MPGIVDLTPGIRSLQVHYDRRVLPLGDRLLDARWRSRTSSADLAEIEVPSRIVHLPLSWDDPRDAARDRQVHAAVRPDAPWCPRNIEFIRRINGLDSGRRRASASSSTPSYLVLGLGDVYLGAPVATPLDPRHRLVTTKYNPARTWTPENAVGIGGAYLCIYGMEGPGGYQFFGRTMPGVEHAIGTTEAFEAGKPWLLRFFDQIRFYPVSSEELRDFREGFLDGASCVEIEPGTFSLTDYLAFLADNAESIAAFKARQQAAFDAERARWQESEAEVRAEAGDDAQVYRGEWRAAAGSDGDREPVPGSVWKILVAPGHEVSAGETLIIVESMKMEIAVCAPSNGKIAEVRCAEGRVVQLGQALVIMAEPPA